MAQGTNENREIIKTENGNPAAAVRNTVDTPADYRELFEKTNELFKVSADNLLQPFVILSPVHDESERIIDFRYEYINKAGCESNAMEREEIIGNLLLTLFPDHRKNGVIESFVKVYITGQPYRGELVYKGKAGNRYMDGVYEMSAAKADDRLIVSWFDLTRLKNTEMKLMAALQEKEVLIKEIHHRVKNNFQVISSLLNLQSNYINSEETRSVFKESRDRINLMALTHEKLYRSGSYTYIRIKDYISDLIGGLESSHHNRNTSVSYSLEVEDFIVNSDLALGIGLITNELVTNALKYAFNGRKDGKISIRLKSDGNAVYLNLRDNGIGIDDDFNLQNLNSLGLQLVSSLVDQHSGSIEFIKQNGTLVNITLNQKKAT